MSKRNWTGEVGRKHSGSENKMCKGPREGSSQRYFKNPCREWWEVRLERQMGA